MSPDPHQRDSAHIPALDGLRGLAVLLVFLLHYGGGAQSSNHLLHIAGVAVGAGWCGVTLFFLLSGFLITNILLRSVHEPHWARNFCARRILRIFPLYYFAIGILIIAGAWQGIFWPTLKTASVFAFFCQNVPVFPAPAYVAAPVFHLSTVAVEEQFYLLWPLTLLFAGTRKRASLICMAVFVASLCFRALIFRHAPDPVLYMGTLFARAGELAVGCLLGLLYDGPRWNALRRYAPFACVVFLGLFFIVSASSGSFQLRTSVVWTYGLPAITLSLAGFLVMAVTPGPVQRLISARWLRWLGRISYGIYVFHILLIHFVNLAAASITGAHTGNAFEAARFLVAVAATLTASWLSYRFLERPFLQLKRFFPRNPTAAARIGDNPFC